jgi:hypothetical protein
MRKSQAHYVNGLERAHNQLKVSIDNFIKSMAWDEKDKKVQETKKLVEAIDRLRVFVDESESPKWLKIIENASKAAVSDPSTSNMQNVNLLVASNYSDITKHIWSYNDQEPSIDLQAEINVFYAGSSIQDLFDDLAAKLRAVIDTGEIEHVSALKSLESLILLIKKNYRNPFTMSVLVSVATSTITNFAKIYPTKENANPVLASAIEAVTKSIEDLNLASHSFAKTTEAKIEASLKQDVPLIAPSDNLLIRLGYTSLPAITDQVGEGTVEE